MQKVAQGFTAMKSKFRQQAHLYPSKTPRQKKKVNGATSKTKD